MSIMASVSAELRRQQSMKIEYIYNGEVSYFMKEISKLSSEEKQLIIYDKKYISRYGKFDFSSKMPNFVCDKSLMIYASDFLMFNPSSMTDDQIFILLSLCKTEFRDKQTVFIDKWQYSYNVLDYVHINIVVNYESSGSGVQRFTQECYFGVLIKCFIEMMIIIRNSEIKVNSNDSEIKISYINESRLEQLKELYRRFYYKSSYLSNISKKIQKQTTSDTLTVHIDERVTKQEIIHSLLTYAKYGINDHYNIYRELKKMQHTYSTDNYIHKIGTCTLNVDLSLDGILKLDDFIKANSYERAKQVSKDIQSKMNGRRVISNINIYEFGTVLAKFIEKEIPGTITFSYNEFINTYNMLVKETSVIEYIDFTPIFIDISSFPIVQIDRFETYYGQGSFDKMLQETPDVLILPIDFSSHS